MTKKIYGFLMLAMVLFTTACKQDPPILPSNLQNAQLIGKWGLTEFSIGTKVNTDAETLVGPISGTANDFFIFAEGNQAVLSSTIYQKSFAGYYSANSAASTLSFKSGELLIKYDVQTVSVTELELSEVVSVVTDQSGNTITTTNYYTYNRLP